MFLIPFFITMGTERLSKIFSLNILLLGILAVWPTKKFSRLYKILSTVYLFFTVFLSFLIATVNLFYLPPVNEVLISEVVFYVSQVIATSKVLVILTKRDDILKALNSLDSGFFMDDEVYRKRIKKSILIYEKCNKSYIILCSIVNSTQSVLPVILHCFMKTSIYLPFSGLFLLGDEVRDKYFVLWYIYLSVVAYGYTMYELNIDAIFFGLMYMAIAHVKVINQKLADFKNTARKPGTEMKKFKNILIQYEFILRFCNSVQKILSVTIFIQFCSSAALICVIMCALLLSTTTETRIFMMTYLMVMIGEIFMPGWLGTQLEFESLQLAFAAYNVDWIPRSERFKRSLRLFVERVNTPIVLTGLKMFPLSLGTFTMIMKTAYSLFTLVRNVQTR